MGSFRSTGCHGSPQASSLSLSDLILWVSEEVDRGLPEGTVSLNEAVGRVAQVGKKIEVTNKC